MSIYPGAYLSQVNEYGSHQAQMQALQNMYQGHKEKHEENENHTGLILLLEDE